VSSELQGSMSSRTDKIEVEIGDILIYDMLNVMTVSVLCAEMTCDSFRVRCIDNCGRMTTLPRKFDRLQMFGWILV